MMLAEISDVKLEKYCRRHLKPLFEEGDEIYAAWWPDDKAKEARDDGGWFPGVVKSYIEVETNSPYGPTRYYDIQYEDGDELDNIEDWYVFPKEDFLLIEQNDEKDYWSTASHNRCIYTDHDNFHDEWPRLVGWYVAIIDGKEHQFSRLSEAILAYDSRILQQKGRHTKRFDLLQPEKWNFDWGDDSTLQMKGELISGMDICEPSSLTREKLQRSLKSVYKDETKDDATALILTEYDDHVGKSSDNDKNEGKQPTPRTEGKQSYQRVHGSLSKDGPSSFIPRKPQRALKSDYKDETEDEDSLILAEDDDPESDYKDEIEDDESLILSEEGDSVSNYKDVSEDAGSLMLAEENDSGGENSDSDDELERKQRFPKCARPTPRIRKGASSSYRGVHWQKNRKKWMARFSQASKDKRHINLGAFLNEKHAALAFDAEARKQGRPDEDLNFPNEMPTAEEIRSWKTANKYKNMTKNGKKASSKYRGVGKSNNYDKFHVQCNINAVRAGLGWPNVVHLGFYASEIVGAHVFDYVCRKFGVPEQELNFPLQETASKKMSRESLEGAQEASRVISLIKSGMWSIRQSKKRWVQMDESDSDEGLECTAEESDEDEVQNPEMDERLFEIEAFVSRPSPGNIEVKFVGSSTKSIKSEVDLRDELDSEGFSRFTHILDRQSSSERSSILDEDISHDMFCMVCNDGGDMICCETCPCVVHTECIHVSKEYFSGSREWRCAICRHQAPAWSLPKMSDEILNGVHSDSEQEDNDDDEEGYVEADDDNELDDDYTGHLQSQKKQAKKKSNRSAGKASNPNNAKPVEKLLFDGTVVGTYRSKREAAASEGFRQASTLGLTGMKKCAEYGGKFWRYKGSSALPRDLGKKVLKSHKPVEQLCVKTGAVIKRFNSVSEASRAVGISAPSISNICNGWKGHNSAGGYSWRFSDNLEQERAIGVIYSPQSNQYPPFDPHRIPVEQLDARTGEVLASFNSKTDATAAVTGSRQSSGVLSDPSFDTGGVFALGFFWRPLGSSFLPTKQASHASKTAKQLDPSTGRIKRKRRDTSPAVQPKRHKRKSNVRLYASEVIGQSVEVYDGYQKQWLEGTVRGFCSDSSQHRVHFEKSKTTQDLDLTKEKVRWGPWRKTQFGSDEDECPICFEEHMESPAATVCGHLFCEACISEWIINTPSCPMCNTSLEKDDAKLVLKDNQECDDPFRAVEQICMTTGKLLRVFPSAASASAHLCQGSSKIRQPSRIIKACKGGKGAPKSVGRFAWRFQGSDTNTQTIGERSIDGRQVECICVETGEVIQTYKSIRSAAELTGHSRAIIYSICKRTRREPFCGGFFWRFKGSSSEPWTPNEKPNCKPVEQLCIRTGKVIKEYPSILKATEALAMGHIISLERWKNSCEKGYGVGSDISEVCRTEVTGRKSAYGFFWRYKGSKNVPYGT